MNILSLDLVTITGWASNVIGLHSGTVEFALRRGESPGMRFLRCRAWPMRFTGSWLAIYQVVDLIVPIEAWDKSRWQIVDKVYPEFTDFVME